VKEFIKKKKEIKKALLVKSLIFETYQKLPLQKLRDNNNRRSLEEVMHNMFQE